MLKKYFEDNWEAFSKKNGGQFTTTQLTDFIKSYNPGPKISLLYKECNIKIDTCYSSSTYRTYTNYTRLVATFPCSVNAEFSLRPLSFSRRIIDKLFHRRLLTGDKKFDNIFFITGDNKAFLKNLFSDEKLRQYISNQPSPLIKLRNDFSESSIYFRTEGFIYDIDELQNLYDLVKYLIDKLNLGKS